MSLEWDLFMKFFHTYIKNKRFITDFNFVFIHVFIDLLLRKQKTGWM